MTRPQRLARQRVPVPEVGVLPVLLVQDERRGPQGGLLQRLEHVLPAARTRRVQPAAAVGHRRPQPRAEAVELGLVVPQGLGRPGHAQHAAHEVRLAPQGAARGDAHDDPALRGQPDLAGERGGLAARPAAGPVTAPVVASPRPAEQDPQRALVRAAQRPQLDVGGNVPGQCEQRVHRGGQVRRRGCLLPGAVEQLREARVVGEQVIRLGGGAGRGAEPAGPAALPRLRQGGAARGRGVLPGRPGGQRHDTSSAVSSMWFHISSPVPVHSSST